MKELIASGDGAVFTESDGEPLPHEEWVRQQHKAEAEEQKRREQERSKATARRRQSQAEDGAEDEPTFRGRALSDFDGVPDDELQNQEGIGEATAKEIVKARHKRDRARGGR